MLPEIAKKDIAEMINIMLKMDNAGKTIMLSNATVLLARQEMLAKAGQQETAKPELQTQ